MKKRAILAAVLAAGQMMIASAAFAEQPAAEGYRSMMEGGKFFLQYGDYWHDTTVAAENGRKMMRENVTSLSMVAFIPIKNSKSYPDLLYKDNKYYKFKDKKTAVVVAKDQLKNVHLNPEDNWREAENKLRVPDALNIFCWNSPFSSHNSSESQPQFVESGQKQDGKKTYAYDKYTSELKSQSGSVMAKFTYIALYEGGKLVQIDKNLTANGEEEKVSTVKIKNLTAEIPTGTLDIPKGCKVYAAGIGDMDDLLEQLIEVEKY
jgi:hypothetical protein